MKKIIKVVLVLVVVLSVSTICVSALSKMGSRSQEVRDIQTVLKEFLLSLDKETRGIFVSRYWLMENSRVIAEKTGMKESNVRVKLLRTREKLRVYLEERGIEI